MKSATNSVRAAGVALAVLSLVGCGGKTFTTVSGEVVDKAITKSLTAQTARTITQFHATGTLEGEIDVAASGLFNIETGDARLAFDDDGDRYNVFVRDSMLQIDDGATMPVASHNSVAGAVAGIPNSPLVLLSELKNREWNKTGETYEIQVPNDLVVRVLNTEATSTLVNRFVGRLDQPDFFQSAKITLQVKIDSSQRIASTHLQAKHKSGKTISTRSKFDGYGSSFDEPPSGEAWPRYSLESDEFNRRVSDLEHLGTGERPLIVTFGARWCPACRALKPELSQFANLYRDEFDFAIIDVDDDPYAGKNFRVTSIPHTFVVKHGIPVTEFVGALYYPELETVLLGAK